MKVLIRKFVMAGALAEENDSTGIASVDKRMNRII
jgi:hypothetical protein